MTVSRSKFALSANNAYFTAPWATKALLRHVDVCGLKVWEPAAGDHRCADVLVEHGANVLTSDIADYGRQHNLIFDFLQDDSVSPWSVDAIITNPPYGAGNRLAGAFCRLALARCYGTVAMLLTANFDSGKTRMDLFGDNPRFHKKIVLVDRIRFFEGEGTMDGTTDHAWFVWGPASPEKAILAYEGKRP